MKTRLRDKVLAIRVSCFTCCGGFLLACSLSVAGFITTVRTAHAQSLATAPRVVQGKVYGTGGEAQAGAIVYLKDAKTLEIKTYIAIKDGTFRFVQLGSQDDYELWAEFGGHKSKVKTISSFDSKKTFDISLHIEDK